jgi:hypothetical protein
VCDQLLMPGVASPQSAQVGLALLEPGLGSLGILPGPVSNPVSGAPVLHSSPPLPCYVFADCPPSVPLKVTVTRRYGKGRRHVDLEILVTSTVSGVTLPVPQAIVHVGAGHALSTNRAGRGSASLAIRKPERLVVTATDREYFDGRETLRLSR